MVVVAEAKPQVAGIAIRMHSTATLTAFAITVTAIGIEACSHVEHTIVIEYESCTGVNITQFNLSFYLITMVTSHEHEGRGIAGELTLAFETDTIGDMLDAFGLIGAIGFPLQSYTELAKSRFRIFIVRGFISNRSSNRANGVGTESFTVFDNRTEPSISGEFYGFEKRLTTDIRETVLISMIDAIPTTIRGVDE